MMIDLSTVPGGTGALLLAILATAALTTALTRWQVAAGFIAARLAEPSTKGALIFASNGFYSFLSGALDWKGFGLILLQSAYHAFQPDIFRLPDSGASIPGDVKSATPAPTAMEAALVAEVDASTKDGRPFNMANVSAALSRVAPVILLIGLGIGLSACSIPDLTGNPTTDLPAIGSAVTSADAQAQQSVATLAKFTATDLQAALSDAQANNDTAAASCYSAILPVVQARETAQGSVVGAISGFQRTRDIVKLVKGQGQIAQACAALKQDVTGDVLGLGALFGLP